MNTLLKRLRFVVALFFTVALVACASGPKQVFHSFQIDGSSDGPPNAQGKYEGWGKAVDLLAYSYGDQYSKLRDSLDNPINANLYAGKFSLPLGSHGVSGLMPIGEFLYVKWRIKATGEVLEDRVDLRGRLPQNMTNHTLTFVPDGKQLRVFVITPFPRKLTHTDPSRSWVVAEGPTHLPLRTKWSLAYEIYPVLEPYPTPTHLTSDQIARCLRLEIACAADKSKK
jgi:hypothetical protein